MFKALTRAEVYSVLDSERAYQEMRRVRDGSTTLTDTNTNGDTRDHSPEEYLLYIEHYLQEARVTASTIWGPDCKAQVMDKLRKVGALVVAAAESNGMPRREGF